MLPGPVFQIELITSARRPRTFIWRTAYGLLLLYLLSVTYHAHFRLRTLGGASTATVEDMANFAYSLFNTVSFVQLLLILALTPLLVGGAISGERQRKTLHDLLASPLTSSEIVLGKLAARLLHLAVFLAVALPILCLTTLFGGILPELVLATFATALSTAFFLSAVSILVSCYTSRVRDSILVVYCLIALWLLGPPLLEQTIRSIWPIAPGWIRDLATLLSLSNPFSILLWGGRVPTSSLPRATLWLAGSQILGGLLLVAVAVWRLRPTFTRQTAFARTRSERRLSRRFFPRPPCDDRPMLWKELHVLKSTGLAWWIIRFCVLVGLAILAYWTAVLGYEAWNENLALGLSPQAVYRKRDNFNIFIRATSGLLYVLYGLGLAAAAATTITSEREEDTWLSLLSTSLEGREILAAKFLGACYSLRGLAASFVLLWVAGVLAGSVHPLGLLAAIPQLAVYSAFIAALGVFFSLRARNSTRAVVACVGTLAFTNLGYFILFIPLLGDGSVVQFLGCTPLLLPASLMSWTEFYQFTGLAPISAYQGRSHYDFAATILACLILHASATFLLARSLRRSFCAAADRPRWVSRVR